MATKDMKMQSDELQALHDQADDVQLRDAPLGQILHNIIHHLGHAHGLDAEAPDAQLGTQSKTKESK
jgi:hypothetical protein